MEDNCDLQDIDLITSERLIGAVCDSLAAAHFACCHSHKYVATIVIEDMLGKARDMKHAIINLRDAMELENDDREVQSMPEVSRDVQEETAK